MLDVWVRLSVNAVQVQRPERFRAPSLVDVPPRQLQHLSALRRAVSAAAGPVTCFSVVCAA